MVLSMAHKALRLLEQIAGDIRAIRVILERAPREAPDELDRLVNLTGGVNTSKGRTARQLEAEDGNHTA